MPLSSLRAYTMLPSKAVIPRTKYDIILFAPFAWLICCTQEARVAWGADDSHVWARRWEGDLSASWEVMARKRVMGAIGWSMD